MEAAKQLARERRGGDFDPALADLIEAEGDVILSGLDTVGVWDAQEVMEELALPEASWLARLVVNEHAEGDEVFKLWPASLDPNAFRASMTNSAITPEGLEGSLIVQAHDFFRLQIREWIESAPTQEDQAARAHGIETALFGLFVMVVIDLATTDDPFVIFETLNARGTPLLASDLVKNYVLQTATMRGLPVDELLPGGVEALRTPVVANRGPAGPAPPSGETAKPESVCRPLLLAGGVETAQDCGVYGHHTGFLFAVEDIDAADQYARSTGVPFRCKAASKLAEVQGHADCRRNANRLRVSTYLQDG